MSDATRGGKTPYKGLDAYTEDDADLLFGRNEERDRVVYSIQSSRLTILYGAREVGKTSLLRGAVVNQLRQDADRRKSGQNPPESAVVVFDEWSGPETVGKLRDTINLEFGRLGISPEKLPQSSPENFLDACKQWTACLGGPEGGELFLVLDAFDDHLMLSPQYDSSPGSFDVELSKVLCSRGLGVNVLIAIRDELLAYLDQYRLAIPDLYANLFRLETMKFKQARDAIQRPVYQVYNKAHPDAQIGIEAELVGAVLASVGSKCGTHDADEPDPDGRFDAGGIQLAMKAVWEREAAEGSRTLRRSTFDALGRMNGIAADYIRARFAAFTARERYLSAKVFDHLLTPGGVGVAYRLSDLALRIGDVDEAELKALIQKLESHQMVMTSVSGETLGSLYYEAANRVLTPAILETVQRYHDENVKEQKKIADGIDRSLQLFSDRSQVDGLRQIIGTCDEWQQATADLLIDRRLEGDLRGALSKTLNELAQTGQLEGYKGAVSSIRYNRDGKFIYTGTESGAVTAWDVRFPGSIKATADQAQKTWIWGLCTSADGRRLASGSDDGSVALWKTDGDGVHFHRMVPFRGASDGPSLVRGLCFSPDGKRLAIAATDGRVRIWLVAEERLERDFAASAAAVRCVEFSPDGTTIATGADDGSIGLWDTTGNSLLRDDERARLRHESAIWALRFHPSRQRLASCGEDHRITVWNLETRTEERTLIGHTCWVLDLDYSPDGALVVSASEDGTARIWNDAGDQIAMLTHGAPVNGVAFSPDGESIATAAADCRVRFWNVHYDRSRRGPRQFRHPKKPIMLALGFTADGAVVTGGTDNEAQIWNDEGGIRQSLQGHNAWIMGIASHPRDPSILATASVDGTARVWNLATGESVPFTPNDGPVWSVAFSPDGRLLATGSAGGAITTWDLHDAADRRALVIPSGRGAVWSLAFNAEGDRIAAGCQQGSIQLLDLNGSRVAEMIEAEDGQILSVSFSPDGAHVASGSSVGRVCVWSLKTGSATFSENVGAPVWSVAFSPAGDLVAGGSVNRSVGLWSLSGERAGAYSADGPIRSLAFHPEGDRIAASCSDGTVRIWPVGADDLEALLSRAKREWDAIAPFVAKREIMPSGPRATAAVRSS